MVYLPLSMLARGSEEGVMRLTTWRICCLSSPTSWIWLSSTEATKTRPARESAGASSAGFGRLVSCTYRRGGQSELCKSSRRWIWWSREVVHSRRGLRVGGGFSVDISCGLAGFTCSRESQRSQTRSPVVVATTVLWYSHHPTPLLLAEGFVSRHQVCLTVKLQAIEDHHLQHSYQPEGVDTRGNDGLRFASATPLHPSVVEIHYRGI